MFFLKVIIQNLNPGHTFEWPSKILKILMKDNPSGAVDKNPPVNAEDMGSIPGPGRSYMTQGN